MIFDLKIDFAMSISWILQHFGLKIAFAMLRLRNLRIPDSHFPDDSDYLLMIQELRHLQGYIWIKNKTLCNQTKKIGVFLFFVGIVGLICTVYFVECRVMINNLYGTFGMMILASILVFLVSRNEEAKLGSRSEFVKRKSLGY